MDHNGGMHETATVTELTTDQCWELLRTTPVGRIATSLAGEPEIFPVNHTVHDGRLVFRTAPGTKLAEVAANHHVAFEIDGWDGQTGWSVTVAGSATIVDNGSALDELEELDLRPWIDSPKNAFVVIEPQRIHGRQFRFSR